MRCLMCDLLVIISVMRDIRRNDVFEKKIKKTWDILEVSNISHVFFEKNKNKIKNTWDILEGVIDYIWMLHMESIYILEVSNISHVFFIEKKKYMGYNRGCNRLHMDAP